MKLFGIIKKVVFAAVLLPALLLLVLLLLAAIGYLPEESSTSSVESFQTTQSVSLTDYLPGGKEITLKEAYRMFPERVAYLAEVGLKLNNGSKLYVKDGKLYVAKITGSDVYYWFIGGEGWHYHLEHFNDSSLLPYTVSGEYLIEKRWWNRLIEKTGEDTYRVTVVHFDDLFTRKYLIVDFNVSLKEKSGYLILKDLGYVNPGYYQQIYKADGRWSATNYTGPLGLFAYKDPNREDNKIIEEVAKQIEQFADENGLNNTQKVVLTAKLVEKMLVHVHGGKVYIYVNGSLRLSDVEVRDSRMKQDLLEGTVSRGFSEWTSSILNEMGIRAWVYIIERDSLFTSHGEVVVDVNDVDVEYIKKIAGKDIAVVNATAGKISMSFVVIEPQGANRDDLGFESLNGVVDPRYPKRYIVFTIHSSKAEQLFRGII